MYNKYLVKTTTYEPLRIEIDLMTCDVKREEWRQKPTLRQSNFSRLFYVVC